MLRLLLVNGLPGSGKTTISRLLCEELKPAAWIDTDDLMHVRPWANEDQRFIGTLRRGLLIAKDFFESGISTVIVAGCVHSKDLFKKVHQSMDLDVVRCTVIALSAERSVRDARQEKRGKKVDVGTDNFQLSPEDVSPAELITIQSNTHSPEETIRELIRQLS
jgi:hypothetical protein